MGNFSDISGWHPPTRHKNARPWIVDLLVTLSTMILEFMSFEADWFNFARLTLG